MNQLIEAWLDVHYELVCLLSPSSFEVKSDGRRAKNTSLDRLRIYSRPVTNHMCQNCRGPLGAKTVTYIWRSRDCNTVYATSRLPNLAPLGKNLGMWFAHQLLTRTQEWIRMGSLFTQAAHSYPLLHTLSYIKTLWSYLLSVKAQLCMHVCLLLSLHVMLYIAFHR